MIRASLVTIVLLLGGCQPAADPTKADAPAAAARAEAVQTATALTAEGWGALRIGMTTAEVTAAMGQDSDPQSVGGPDPEACDLFHPANAPEGLMAMVEGGRLTSIWLDPGSNVKTDRGFGLGDTAAAVKAAYGDDAHVSPHKYSEPPAEYVTVWVKGGSDGYVQDPAARGISYHIGTDGRVEHIAAGAPSIQYVEGCA